MCDPATIAYGFASLAGTKMQIDAQEEAADRQQAALNAALEQNDQYSQQAEHVAMQNAAEYTPGTRAQRFDEARTAAGDSLAQQLTASREAAPVKLGASGRLSEEFNTDSAKASADQYQQSIDMARLMGKMRGASDMLTNEGYTNADYASQLGLIGRNAQGAYQAAQPGINAAGRVDQGSMLAGGLAQGVGMAGMSSSLGKSMAGMFGNSGASAAATKAANFAVLP